MKKIAIIASTDRGLQLGKVLQREFEKSVLVSTRAKNELQAIEISSIAEFLKESYASFDAFIFIGALGICVRSIATYLDDKTTDPAVVNVDEMGRYTQVVVGGHVGGANDLCLKISKICGAEAVITTSTDLQQIWSLDTLGEKYNWHTVSNTSLNECISLFANNKATA